MMRMHMGQTMALAAADGMTRPVRSCMERLPVLGAADPGVLDRWIARMLSEQISFQVRSSVMLHATQLTQLTRASHSAAGMVPGGCARGMCIVDEAAVQIVLKQKLKKQPPQQHDGAHQFQGQFQRQNP